MGNNRRPRTSQQHHQQHQNQQNHRNHSDCSGSGQGSGINNNNNRGSSGYITIHSNHHVKDDPNLNAALQQVEGGSKEILMFILAIACSIVLAMLVGIAAGMTISIHYFENQSPVVGGKMSPQDQYLIYSGPSAFQKVTILDPSIASSNVIQRDRDGLDLGKVITTSASGQLNVLMVVEETTPLHPELEFIQNQGSASATDNKGGAGVDDGTDSSEQGSSSRKSTPLTMDQAEALSPGYAHWKRSQPHIELREPTVLPTICNDGRTLGFDSWTKLRAAVQEANSISAERFMKWSEYFATNAFSAFDDDRLYYEEDVIFTICPGATLRARKGPIFINAENVVLECTGLCVVDVGGTHLAFGPNAKNTLVRGITFKRARTSSLTFFHDGADASFEDCSWIDNRGINSKFGSVADVNSTSVVNFYRCEIGVGTKKPLSGMHSGSSSSLSIRS
jgi:hypothetical protein